MCLKKINDQRRHDDTRRRTFPPTIAIGHFCGPNDLETHLGVSIIKFVIKEREFNASLIVQLLMEIELGSNTADPSPSFYFIVDLKTLNN